MIFIFGSNLSGIHGLGAAKHAYLHHGAIWGEGVGLHGSSYAIPTKDYNVKDKLILDVVQKYVDDFVLSTFNSGLEYKITRVGCGYAGFSDIVMADMFKEVCKESCYFDKHWERFLGSSYKYWGSYEL